MKARKKEGRDRLWLVMILVYTSLLLWSGCDPKSEEGEECTAGMCSVGSIEFVDSNLRDCIMDTIPEETFLEEVTTIECPARNIQSAVGLKHFCQLQYLDLSNNNIGEIVVDAFAGLGNLQSLDLGGNNIRVITKGAFAGLGNLQRLRVGSTGTTLEALEAAFGTLWGQRKVKLRHLYLNRNGITMIKKGAFAGLENLRMLDLSGNQIEKIAENAFAGLENLQRLSLSGNPIKIIEGEPFASLENLQELYLSKQPCIDGDCERSREDGEPCRGGQICSIEFVDSNLRDCIMNTIAGNTPVEQVKRINCQGKGVQSARDLGHFPNLLELYLNDNNIEKVAEYTFAGLKRLQWLYLDRNQIGKIAENAFAGLESLRTLNLSGNQIWEIAADAFAGLKNLHHLYLNDNNIEKVVADIFAGLENLRTLNLSGNQIWEIAADAFAGLKNLHHLYLNDNNIEKVVADIFAGLENLQRLSLSGNPIKIIEGEPFASLENLQELYLSKQPCIDGDCERSREDGEPCRGGQICSIKFVDSNLRDCIMNTIAGNTPVEQVKRINCQSKGVQSARDLGHFGRLQWLDLSGNQIREIAENAFASLTSLQELNLNDNNIEKIEQGAFVDLTNLERLYLIGNQIREIVANTFAGLKNLKHLYLSHNNIGMIAADVFASLTSLQELNLNDNNIGMIEQGAFAGLKNLQHLNLNNNNIGSQLQEQFEQLTKLQRLYVARTGTTLEALKAAFGDLWGETRLQYLDLSNNNIEKVAADAFAGLKRLEWLYLDRNQIGEIAADAFAGLTSLQELHLYDNRDESEALTLLCKSLSALLNKLSERTSPPSVYLSDAIPSSAYDYSQFQSEDSLRPEYCK